MTSRHRIILLVLTLCVAASAVMAQRFRSRGPRDMGNPRASAEAPVPEWKRDNELPEDVFTFTRVRYSSGYGYGRRSGGGWSTDWPDADLNLSYRLQQVTSMKVHPDGKIVDLTDPKLFDHPFIYIAEPGAMELDDAEVKALRRYLLNGGFLMVDDFWGTRQWENFYYEFKKVFPEKEPVELPMDHPVFLGVLPLKVPKQELQIPNIRTGAMSAQTGITWEYHDGEECREVHIMGVFDDKGRMMAIFCHNTDNGDGWEREGEDTYYFKTFSERRAYPLMINILFYAMTH